MEKVSVFCFSKKGYTLAKRICEHYKTALIINDFKQLSLREQVAEQFIKDQLLIFVGAVGIAVRGIAPFIKGKDVDPAVLVVDELGDFVIPILSGHLGGANEYGEELARILGATPVITTATDINKVFAVDVWAKNNGLIVQNVKDIKHISGALLEGQKIGFISDYSEIRLPINIEKDIITLEQEDEAISGILIAQTYRKCFTNTLWLTPKKYVLGVGCRKNMNSEEFEKQVIEFLEKQKIPLALVECMASIDLKAKEEAICSFAKKYRIEYGTFSPRELANVSGDFQKSDFVQSVTGVDNVCERSAMLASGASELLIPKTIIKGMTIAVSIKHFT